MTWFPSSVHGRYLRRRHSTDLLLTSGRFDGAQGAPEHRFAREGVAARTKGGEEGSVMLGHRLGVRGRTPLLIEDSPGADAQNHGPLQLLATSTTWLGDAAKTSN